MNHLWSKWKATAQAIGNFQANIIFSILYFLIITPLGLVVSQFNDFFEIKHFPHWHPIPDTTSTIDKLKEQ